MIKGLDVSQFNSVDLQGAKNDGIEFVIARAGYGTPDNNANAVDPKFRDYWNKAGEVGLVRLAYWYAYPGRSSAVQQAREFLRIVGTLAPGDGIALDMEDDVTYGRRLVASDVQWSKDFLDYCQSQIGVKGLLYINSDVRGRFDWNPVQDANYGLWQANYGPNNGQPNTEPAATPWEFNAIWQYTSKGSAGGGYPLDMNIFNGTREQLLKYGASGSVNPTPTPTPTPEPAPSSKYTIKPGDTFWGLEEKNGWTHGMLQNLNPGVNPTTLQVNQQINVPGSGGGGQSGNSYKVVSPVPGYVTAQDAINGKNSNSTVPAGTYAIFNKVNGAVNITRQAGVPGWWIKG